MIYFTMQNWFYEKLKDNGYNFQENWKEYVNKDKWIKKLLKVNQEDIQDCEIKK